MTTPARNLTLLRLNDRIVPGSDQDYPFIGIDLFRFETVEGVEKDAIVSWEDALLFWGSVGDQQPPDLIVGDVNFDQDSTTPLHPEGEDTRIPTGLSHLKPIAAFARAMARPIGIGIHTG